MNTTNLINWHDYFVYDDAGSLVWKKREPRSCSSKEIQACSRFNTIFCGKVAGTITLGYVRIKVTGLVVGAHRIIWEMHNGPLPDGMVVDHINMDTLDNRICNLRAATLSQNMMNKKASKRNTSGVKGVTFDKETGKWLAHIGNGGKQKNIGRFHSIEEAADARKKAATEHHGEFARF